MLALAAGELLFKVGLYTYARTRPLQDPRMLVIHGDLGEREITELLYRVGLSANETTPIDKADFHNVVERLKAAQTIDWKDSVLNKLKSTAQV